MSERPRTTLTVNVPTIFGLEDTPIIDVRDSRLRLVARVAPGAQIEVEPGLYTASVSLPTGGSEQGVTLVEEGHTASLLLGSNRAYDVVYGGGALEEDSLWHAKIDDDERSDADLVDEDIDGDAMQSRDVHDAPDVVRHDETQDAEPGDIEGPPTTVPDATDAEEREGQRAEDPGRKAGFVEPLPPGLPYELPRYFHLRESRHHEIAPLQPWSLRVLSARTGEPLRGGWEAHKLGRYEPRRGVRRAMVRVDLRDVSWDQGLIAQVAARGAPVWSASLPANLDAAPHERGCDVLVRVGEGEARASVMFGGEGRVATIANYMRAGRLTEAARIATGAERLLQGKRADPVGAALGAYALLRLGDLERLHGWTQNLMNWYPWLPDGAIVAAEHARREGDASRADECYVEALRRGIPVFADGLSLLVSHLRTARSATEHGHVEGRWSLESIRTTRLQQVAVLAARDDLLVAYPGADPLRPAATLAPRERITPRGWQVFR